MAFKQRTYTEVPHDEAISPQIREFLAALLSQVNALSGQGTPTTGQGIQALSLNSIDPTTGQINSAGSRASSVATSMAFVASTTSAGASTITFYWDGTNGSQIFKIGRDDGSVYGPNPAGSPLAVSGLQPSTTYYLYPYFDEGLQKIVFASVPGKSVGKPPVAFTAQNFKAAQQQIMRGHIPLAVSLGTGGTATPATPGSGTTTNPPAPSGTGGGASGTANGAGGRFLLE